MTLDLEDRTYDTYDTGIILPTGNELRTIGEEWDPDEILPRTVTAYALRWNVPVLTTTVDGDECWVQYRSDSFDEWLARPEDRDSDDWPRVLLSHGWGPVAGDYRGGLPDEVGQSVSVQKDHVGLLATCVMLESRSSSGPLDAIRRGELKAFSAHVLVQASREIGTFRGLPLHEATRCWPVEFGPTHDPSDPGALIVALGDEPIEAVWARHAGELAQMRTLLGIADEVSMAAEARGLAAQASAQARATRRDAIREVQSLAGAVAFHRGRAHEALADFRRTGRGEYMSAAVEANRLAEDADAELRDACCSDRYLHDDVLAAAGAPEPLSALQLAGIEPVVRTPEQHIEDVFRRRAEARALYGEWM